MYTCFHCGEEIHWKPRKEFWVHKATKMMRCPGSAATDLFYAEPDARGSTLPEYLERNK